jgi:Zn finger protein HypA/HybF involved in hydrogenase expression
VTFNDILQEKMLVSRATLEGERKQVAVLCRGCADRSDRLRCSLTPNYCAICHSD